MNLLLLCEFLSLALSVGEHPIYFVSGFGGSPLFGTVLDDKLYPQCANITHQQYFPAVDEEFYVNQSECQSLFMTVRLENGKVKTLPGIEVETLPFGEWNFGWEFSLNDDHKFTGVSFNFMNHFLTSEPIYEQLKANIDNQTEKVVLIGYSQGTHFLIDFLQRFVNDANWTQEHIDGVVLLAPAVGGFLNLQRQIDQTMDPFISNDQMKVAIQRMPGLHNLLPNYHVYNDTALIENYTNGTTVKASQIYQFLRENDRLDNDAYEIFKLTEKDHLQNDYLEELGVRTLVLYNSGVPTIGAYRWNNTIDDMIPINRPGDGEVTADGAQYLCRNWINFTTCVDFHKENAFTHKSIVHEKDVIERIIQFIELTEEKVEIGGLGIFIVVIAIAALQAVVLIVVLFILCKNRGNDVPTVGSFVSFG